MVSTNYPSISSDRVARVGCYACGGSSLLKKFSVTLFDGPYLQDRNAKLRTIYQCDSCGHLSGDSCDQGQYSAYYLSLSDDYHRDHDNEQSRYEEILTALSRYSPRRVLDIGCGIGTFLAMLPPDIERFGIEPSELAARHSRSEGIKTIQYDDLAKPEFRNTFDVVTAIDVVEHAVDLTALRRCLLTALRPGGILIILTGDAESAPARLLGRYWSYINYAEHITTFCPRSMRTWLGSDFSMITIRRTSHHPIGMREGLSLVRMWLFFPIKWFLKYLKGPRPHRYLALSLWHDHMFVLAIRK